MGLAIAAFHWTSADFGRATPHEFWSAYEVWREMNTVPKDGETTGTK